LAETTHTTVALFKAVQRRRLQNHRVVRHATPYCSYYSVDGSDGSFERSRDQGRLMQETTND
jgi:hypothetical protein